MCISLVVPCVGVAGGMGLIRYCRWMDGQVQGRDTVAAIDTFACDAIVTARIIRLPKPRIAVTVGYTLVGIEDVAYGQLECDDRVTSMSSLSCVGICTAVCVGHSIPEVAITCAFDDRILILRI